MKYALVNNELQEAQPKINGECQCCNRPVIAKCGEVKIWHWSHKGKLICDPWWENETEWHRAWKGQFPKEWQEVIHYAEDGEKHIADVKTDRNIVIEFQNSPMPPEERRKREFFYKNMIWVVNGKTKPKSKFLSVYEDAIVIDKAAGLRKLYHPEGVLLNKWSNSPVAVFFDFGEELLYGVLSNISNGDVYVFKFARNELIASLQPATAKSFEEYLRKWVGLIKTYEYQRKQRSYGGQYMRLPRMNRYAFRF